ncbi:hypothetical protein K474DRAFT_1655355 [Panus rudis PR-1116 ss-1]|nr:hypothetical protein K474DRAFT_1655355 [Panus rudis PR-1116 ss-1]
MDGDEDWNGFLSDHPIFALSKRMSGSSGRDNISLELSLSSLPDFTDLDDDDERPTPSGRRQVMVIKDAELIVAAGSEVRIASLLDAKLHKGVSKAYKTLHTPNIGFEIHSMVLNPNSKLLAVAGAYQVAVIVLPRPGFMKLVPTMVDCKSIQVGQYIHAFKASAPIAKIDWHPWGDGGTTLLVMTVDGKLREYDIAIDTEEPQQTLTFVPEKKGGAFLAADASEREVVSFTLGKGNADWGPLSVYALMRSGDIYAICPYMPKNASIPSSYVHALECFVHAKQEFLSQTQTDTLSTSLSSIYEYQHKYVSALLRQLPPGTAFPGTSRSVLMHPPTTIKSSPIRQGPFLLQPAPRILDGSEGGDATDLVYLAFGSKAEDEENEGETERLGVILVSYKDGKVDVCLDVEKVEAKWEHRQHKSNDLPMLAVYESIDLGIICMLSKVTAAKGDEPILRLLEGNHPVFLRDPIQDETVYVYHAFGVHTLHLGSLLQSLATALRDDTSNDGEEDVLGQALSNSERTAVHPILTTFSVERKCSNPIIGVSIPNDVYLTYSIFILTSAMRVVCFPLTLQSEVDAAASASAPAASPELTKSQLGRSQNNIAQAPEEPPAYVSLLNELYTPAPVLSRPSGLPANPILVLPPAPKEAKGEFMLTPDTLRYLGTTFERFMGQIREVQLAYNAAKRRAELQKQEFRRQQEKCKELLSLIDKLHDVRPQQTREKVAKLKEVQKELLKREERILQGLMKTASPELSEHETKWFQELNRMKEEVKGVGRYDEGSLEARAALLRREYERMLPALKELQAKEERIKMKLSEKQQTIGVSQAFELGERSNAERAKISRLEDEILRLAQRLDVSLGRPPPLEGQNDER